MGIEQNLAREFVRVVEEAVAHSGRDNATAVIFEIVAPGGP